MTDTPRVPLIITMDQVAPEDVTWLWHPYIPRRKVTLLEGDPGDGKTWLALTISSNVSNGDPFPGNDSHRPARNVLILSAEDGLGDTLRPRLDAAGADVSRVHALLGWQQGEMSGSITLGDLPPIEEALKAWTPALLVVDPLQAFLGAAVDMHRANETRPILTGLAALAEAYDCAILVIRHLGKSAKDRAVYRGLGSIDFAAAARSILLVGHDPQQPRRRVMAHVKSSLAPHGGSLGYELREGRFWWTGPSAVSAEDLLRASPMDEERSATEEAIDFLRDILADGEKPAKDVIREAKRAGISEITLRRAKAGIVHPHKAHTVGGKRGEGPWVWTLLDDQASSLPPQRNDDHVEHIEERQINQCVPTDFLDGHVSIMNNNGNHEPNQQVTNNVLDDHSLSVGGNDQDDHLDHPDQAACPTCGGTDFAHLTPEQVVCMGCLKGNGHD